jgi:hypothetical protein
MVVVSMIGALFGPVVRALAKVRVGVNGGNEQATITTIMTTGAKHFGERCYISFRYIVSHRYGLT